MVITLLETCGHYFDRGSSKRKLDRFLIHFQRYILSKGALPLDIEFDLQVSCADPLYSLLFSSITVGFIQYKRLGLGGYIGLLQLTTLLYSRFANLCN